MRKKIVLSSNKRWGLILACALIGVNLLTIVCIQESYAGHSSRATGQPYNSEPTQHHTPPGGEIPAAKHLDIGVNLFSYITNIVLGQQEKDFLRQNKNVEAVYFDKVPEGIRKVESYSLAVMLTDQLESTGAFKSVSMRPGDTEVHDLIITGKIAQSTGNVFRVLFCVEDSAGKEWVYDYGLFDQYHPQLYEQKNAEDPYFFLFERFTKQLLHHISTINPKYFKKLARVTDMKYAASLSPSIFSSYISVDTSGHYRLTGMPADNDPFWTFAMKCRDEESRIVTDGFGGFYTSTHAKVYPQYFDWRHEYGSSRIEYEKLRQEIQRDMERGRNEGMMEEMQERMGKLLPVIINGGNIKESVISTTTTEGIRYLTSGMAIDESGNLYFDRDKTLEGNPKFEEYRRKARLKGEQAAAYQNHMVKQSEAFSSAADPISIRLFQENIELEGTVNEKFSAFRKKMEAVYREQTGGIHAKAAPTGV